MKQSIVHVAIVVRDYDEALEFYINKLKFTLIEDTYQSEQDKRWVVVSPPGSGGTTLLLAKASKPEQEPFIGNQTGGRVFLFLNTDDFWRDHADMTAAGIKFVREPKRAEYGMVAVFEDLYGNLWDLLQLNEDHPLSRRTGIARGEPGPGSISGSGLPLG
jgi:catechol 2,3-dioxygenase-like lactoylglutathione lyase family enzyme